MIETLGNKNWRPLVWKIPCLGCELLMGGWVIVVIQQLLSAFAWLLVVAVLPR